MPPCWNTWWMLSVFMNRRHSWSWTHEIAGLKRPASTMYEATAARFFEAHRKLQWLSLTSLKIFWLWHGYTALHGESQATGPLPSSMHQWYLLGLNDSTIKHCWLDGKPKRHWVAARKAWRFWWIGLQRWFLGCSVKECCVYFWDASSFCLRCC